MRHAVIVAHPDPASFTMAVANVYSDALAARGHSTIRRDLYKMDFDPRLLAEELPTRPDYAPREDVIEERDFLHAADVIAFFYPFWLNTPPAILKGYMDRVFGFGFAYGKSREGNVPLLAPRKMISFTSSGAPTEWMKTTGTWEAMCALFDEHFASVCGLEVLDHVHAGQIIPNMRRDVAERHFDTVRSAVERYF